MNNIILLVENRCRVKKEDRLNMTTACKMHQRPSELFVELRTASIKCKPTTSQVCREAIAALTKAYWEAPNLSCRTTDPSFKVLTELFKSCRWNKTTKHCKYHRFWKLCFKIKRPHQTFQRTILFIIHISSFVIKIVCTISHRINTVGKYQYVQFW